MLRLRDRLLFAVGLPGTEIIAIGYAANGYRIRVPLDDVGQCMLAFERTCHLILWVAVLKPVKGGLMFFRRTSPLAILMTLPLAFVVLL